jgi:hypothetical protein
VWSAELPTAKAHAISWDVGIKLDTQKEKVKIFNKKKVSREVVARNFQ